MFGHGRTPPFRCRNVLRAADVIPSPPSNGTAWHARNGWGHASNTPHGGAKGVFVMSRSSLAAVRETAPDAGTGENAAMGGADGAFAALAQTARLVEALAQAGPGEKPLLAAAMGRLPPATPAAAGR